MNAREGVSEPSMDDSNLCEQSQEDDTGVDAPVENQATDQEGSIIDETLDLSTIKDRTRSKSKKYVIPTALSPPDSEDEQPRPSLRKKTQRGASISRAGITGTRTNLQVPPAGSLMPEGDGLAAASQNMI